MRKIKITKEQYDRIASLNESSLNPIDKSFVKSFSGSKVQNMTEEPFDIKKPVSGIPNSKMKSKVPSNMNEDLTGSGLHQAIHDFIQNIWMNPSHKGLDKALIDKGLNWGDVATYLTSVGILSLVGAGVYKVNNYFKRVFGQDKNLIMKQKLDDIDKMVDLVEKQPKAPWNSNKLKEPNGQQLMSKEVRPEEMEEDASNYPPGTENDPNSPWNQNSDDVQYSNAPKVFKPIALGHEIAILDGPNGMYVFYFDDINRDDMPNPNYVLNSEDVADYVNSNIKTISKGEGLQAFEQGADLVKIDEPLKTKLIALYGKDKGLVNTLTNIKEMTSAASSGAFVAPLAGNPEDDVIEEMTAANGGGDGSIGSSSTGAYVQPKIWAKDKSNWAASKKIQYPGGKMVDDKKSGQGKIDGIFENASKETQYPGGEMVSFDPCTKLNNNKAAQNGKCSQGAVDNVVKTHKTKGSVTSKSIYEEISAKTGRTVEDIKKVIDSKLIKNKSLS